MNIRDIVAQEQAVTGKETGRSSVYAGQMAGEGMVSKLVNSGAIAGTMDVPVTPSAQADG